MCASLSKIQPLLQANALVTRDEGNWHFQSNGRAHSLLRVERSESLSSFPANTTIKRGICLVFFRTSRGTNTQTDRHAARQRYALAQRGMSAVIPLCSATTLPVERRDLAVGFVRRLSDERQTVRIASLFIETKPLTLFNRIYLLLGPILYDNTIANDSHLPFKLYKLHTKTMSLLIITAHSVIWLVPKLVSSFRWECNST